MKYLLILLTLITVSHVSYADDQVPFASELNSNIKHYNRVTPLLATSGAINRDAINELAHKKIKTIINLRTKAEGSKKEKQQVEAAGMTYIHIPVSVKTVNDDKILAKLTKALDAIKSPTLLHCGSGNRAGALLTRYYISKGVSAKTALEIGRTAGLKSGVEKKIKDGISQDN